MQEYILVLMEQFGYAAMFVLILLENLLPPIPSEVILVFGGVLCAQTDLTVGGMLLAATAGSLAGAVILYEIGAELPLERLNQLLKKLGFKNGDLEKTLKWFRRYDRRAVFLCRFVPVVRSLISIPAGMEKMPIALFLSNTIAGSLIWNLVLLCLGKKAGNSWEIVMQLLDRYSNVLWLVILGIVCVKFLHRQLQAKKQRTESIKRTEIK